MVVDPADMHAALAHHGHSGMAAQGSMMIIRAFLEAMARR